MADLKKVAIYSAVVGLITPFVVKLLAKLPTVQVTLSTIELNVRQNVGTLAGQGSSVGEYVLSLLGSPMAQSPIMGYVGTAIGMALLGIVGFMIAESLGYAKTKAQRGIVPLAIASALAGLIVIPWLGGTKLGLDMFSFGSIILALNLAAGASVVTGINVLLDDPFELIP